MFKICNVGCGNMSTLVHGPSFKKYAEEYKDVCLAACCDLDEEKAKEYKEKFGFERYYTDYLKMIDEEKPDVVSLICPVWLTKKLSIEIMKKGCNIILEKPPGLNREEIEEMIKQAKESNVFVRVAYNRRYAPLIIKLKEALKDKQIHNITYQLYRKHRRESFFETTSSHAIDATKYILGSDYKKAEIKFQEMPELGEKVANFYINAEFENGAIGQISLITNCGAALERITVNTLDETFLVELPMLDTVDGKGRFRHIVEDEVLVDITSDELVDEPVFFETNGFYNENSLFFEMIRSGADVSCDLESTIQSVELVNCISERITEYKK